MQRTLGSGATCRRDCFGHRLGTLGGDHGSNNRVARDDLVGVQHDPDVAELNHHLGPNALFSRQGSKEHFAQSGFFLKMNEPSYPLINR